MRHKLSISIIAITHYQEKVLGAPTIVHPACPKSQPSTLHNSMQFIELPSVEGCTFFDIFSERGEKLTLRLLNYIKYYTTVANKSSSVTSDCTMPEYIFCFIPKVVTKVSFLYNHIRQNGATNRYNFSYGAAAYGR